MSDETPATVTEDTVLLRRAPRYPRFLVLGAGVGLLAAFLGTAVFPIDPGVGFGALFGYFAVIAVPLGAALGGGVAIVADVVATRRAKRIQAERVRVDAVADSDLDAEDEPLEGDLEN